MKTFNLKGTKRTELGKKASKTVRKVDEVPCVLYGGKENVFFTVPNKEIQKLIYSPDVFVINLDIDGQKFTSIIQEIQFHPVTDAVLHMDFLEINEKKPVVVELPVKLEGLAEGVKAGGKLSLELRHLKVKGIYTKLPENITIDVTSLGLGKSIQIGALSFKDFEILNTKTAIVAQVKTTRAAREAAVPGK
ncbi:MAG TPA: 50S ribosomal protein L25/general stress protein Ctc [Paludibacteraceae bacterium]|nr:50S ribosomal protein L25/general stress protein Ctc [Paludibacteraceae bacterium]